MNENRFIRLNTAFKPPENVAKAAIALSKKISQSRESFFVLDGISFYPHITIYSPEYPESNLDKVLKAAEEIANNRVRIKFTFLPKENHQGFISLAFNPSPEIEGLHREVVTKFNPLREGRKRDKYKMPADDYKMTFSSEQQENIEKYGYPDAMNLYVPHLTIIRLKDESLAEKIEKDLNWLISQFIVDKIAVYMMGEHGTCKKLVKEFNLK